MYPAPRLRIRITIAIAAVLIACGPLPDIVRALPADTPSTEVGWYFSRFFGTRDYHAHPQNWAIVQDDRGVMYFGNGAGVLEYDGVSWRLIRIPNKTTVRALAVDQDGTILVGAMGDFGYLAPDSTGTLRFVSLLPAVPPDDRAFTDVWRIVTTSDGVYFSSRERLFRWSRQAGTDLQVWTPERFFALGFALRDTFYTLEPRKGLLRIENGTLVAAPGGEAFARNVVFFALPFDEGSLLLGTRNVGLMRYDGRSATAFATEADASLRRDLLYHGTVLSDGTLALATRAGGLYLVDRSGKLLRVLDERSGLPGRELWYVYEDRQGGLWLALNKGLARLETMAQLTFFGEGAGLEGIVTDIRRHGSDLYAATSRGVYRLSTSAGRPPWFERVQASETGQCLHLLSTGHELLASCEGGLYKVAGTSAQRIYGDITRLLYLAPDNPDLMLAATRDGLLRFVRKGGAWQRQEIVPDVPGWALSIQEDRNGSLWLTTTSEGIVRIDAWDSAEPIVMHYGPDDGIPPGWAYVSPVGGTLVFHTISGIYRFDEATQPPRFVQDTLLSGRLPYPDGEVFQFMEDHHGNIWFNNNTTTGIALRQPDGSYAVDTTSLRRMPPVSVFAILPEENGVTWIGTEEGLFRYDPAAAWPPAPGLDVLIRRVVPTKGDSVLFGGAGTTHRPVRLPYARQALRFEFALPAFDGPEGNTYRVRLEGFDEAWSDWSGATSKDYTNLPPGSYVFQVQARDVYGRHGADGAFHFSVLPPWYATWWAYLLYAIAATLLVGCLLYGGMLFRTRRLQARNTWLEREVAQRTEALQRANQSLEIALAQNREFMSIAAHDIKNPVAGIVGISEMLLEEHAMPPDMEEFVSIIRDSALRLYGIAEHLQDTEVLEQGQITLCRNRHDLVSLTRSVLRRNEVIADAKSIRLELIENGPVHAEVDEQYLPRVLDNLISNAIKFSPIGSSVRVSVSEQHGRALVAVQDEGPGLTEEDKAHVFGKLRRLSARPTAGESSTGLGLYIAHMIATLHGGVIHVDSVPGQGATFTVDLDASPAPAEESEMEHAEPDDAGRSST